VADLRLACTQLADPASVKIEGLVHDLQPSIPPGMQESAAFALCRVSGEGIEAKAAITAAGAIPALVHLLASDSPGVRGTAVWALGHLASGHTANQSAVVAAGAVPLLVQLLRPASNTSTIHQRAAVWALGSLAAEHTANQTAIVAAGAVPLLVQLQGSTDANVRGLATATLATLRYLGSLV
jgi:HEAT repeat protein